MLSGLVSNKRRTFSNLFLLSIQVLIEELQRDDMNTKITDEIQFNSINQFNDELFMCATYNEISTINEGCAVCA